MTTWYDPQEIKDEADGRRRQPEFPPEVVPEEPIIEGPLASEKMLRLIVRQKEIADIVDTFDQ